MKEKKKSRTAEQAPSRYEIGREEITRVYLDEGRAVLFLSLRLPSLSAVADEGEKEKEKAPGLLLSDRFVGAFLSFTSEIAEACFSAVEDLLKAGKRDRPLRWNGDFSCVVTDGEIAVHRRMTLKAGSELLSSLRAVDVFSRETGFLKEPPRRRRASRIP